MAELAEPETAPPVPVARRRWRWISWLPIYIIVLEAALVARVAWLDAPDKSLIFDEAYYVNATRIIVGRPVAQGAPYAGSPVGLDPNVEHPALGKALMAASMRVFGDVPLGWRFPSLVAGMASILLVFAIVRAAGGDHWLAVLASGLFAADNLALVHSRIGTLDMLLVAFLLLAAWLYLRGRGAKAGALAGAACALATLVKIGGVYGLAALLLFAGAETALGRWRSGSWPRDHVLRTMLLVVTFVPVWFAGMALLDLKYTTYRSPIAHLQHIISYGFALSRAKGPANVESDPWQWLINEVQMPYLRVDEQVKSGDQVLETRATISFRGAMNPIIIGAAPLALSYATWRAWRLRDPLSLWVIAWVGGTYLPFVFTATYAHRISYIFYFLPTLPAVAVALAQLLRQSGLPGPVLWGYLAMVAVGFAGYFPFRRWVT